MNRLKIGAKHLIKSAAEAHKVKPTTVIKLFRHAEKADGSNLSAFANLMQMCLTHRSSIKSLLRDKTAIEVVDAKLTQPQIDSYNYLYHTIDNFYIRNVKDFSSLTFYPRIEDLFSKKAVCVTAEPEIPQPEPAPYPTLTRIGFQTKDITWNTQQSKALKLVFKWLRTSNRKQVFRLFGYAGVGKTELSKAIADFVMNEQGKGNVPTGDVMFAAYTGKACSVLRSKGCLGADTLHSALYKPVIDSSTGQVKDFILNYESPLSQASLLIVDEVSMVNEEMAEHILSFGVPVLVLGDPAQLPPVEGSGWFINAEPDYMLTDIERQAKDNPIIYLATRAREGKYIKPGRYGNSRVYDQGKYVSEDMYLKADQILCGLNNTRKTINKKMRRYNGTASKSPIYPTEGDRLICLRNNRNSGLYNGTMWAGSQPIIAKAKVSKKNGNISYVVETSADVLAFKVTSLDELGRNGDPIVVDTQCSLHHFNEAIPEPDWREIAGTDQWDFGFGITVHKGQGSQWDNVLMFDEANTFREHADKHRYTGITRAAEEITILL